MRARTTMFAAIFAMAFMQNAFAADEVMPADPDEKKSGTSAQPAAVTPLEACKAIADVAVRKDCLRKAAKKSIEEGKSATAPAADAKASKPAPKKQTPKPKCSNACFDSTQFTCSVATETGKCDGPATNICCPEGGTVTSKPTQPSGDQCEVSVAAHGELKKLLGDKETEIDRLKGEAAGSQARVKLAEGAVEEERKKTRGAENACAASFQAVVRAAESRAKTAEGALATLRTERDKAVGSAEEAVRKQVSDLQAAFDNERRLREEAQRRVEAAEAKLAAKSVEPPPKPPNDKKPPADKAEEPPPTEVADAKFIAGCVEIVRGSPFLKGKDPVEICAGKK